MPANLKNKPDSYWKQHLTPEQYKILRQKGTESPFTGIFLDNHEEGVYKCVACKQPLFSSDAKYNSGSGWPSFFDVIDQGNVQIAPDESHDMSRIEVSCSKCNSHLGHLFTDGPQPTGIRYCVNSTALDFDKKQRT